MWNDRFLFVASALIAMASVMLFKHRTPNSEKILKIGPITITIYSIWVVVGILLITAILGSRALLYWNTSKIPNAGNLLTILLGAAVGTFTVRFVSRLFASEFGKDEPIIGASVLALLCIVYSLPLYSDAISQISTGIGLSSLKTPFLEFTLRDRGSKSFTAAGGGQVNLGGVPRSSNPGVGLQWLDLDTKIEYDKDAATFPMDKAYIRYFEEKIDKNDKYEDTVNGIKKFTKQARVLSLCLQRYIASIPDSALLLVDISPVLQELFDAHQAIKRTGGSMVKISFWNSIQEVVQNVNKHIKQQSCVSDNTVTESSLQMSAYQPYNTLVLADLIYARGAPDEAIEVLAEWLSRNSRPEGEGVAAWWKLRVMSRIALWMAEVSGQNNIAYQTFINSYRTSLQQYFQVKDVTLGTLKSKCEAWGSTPHAREQAGEPENLLIEQKAFYQLLATEDESLRTEINFIGETGDFDELENLEVRAAVLSTFDRQCLPYIIDEAERANIIADFHITIGMVELTLADKMHSLAQSRGDHERAKDIAREAEKFLRQGYARLYTQIKQYRSAVINAKSKKDYCIGCEDWTTRIFDQSPWEKSANLAGRGMLRLRSPD